jgi:hypothetical protein
MQYIDAEAGRWPVLKSLPRNIESNGRCGRKGPIMVKNIEDVQKMGKDNMEAAMTSFGAVSKSLHAIAVEMTDYSKKSFEQTAAAAEKLVGAKSVERALEVQADYAKRAYESFVSQAAKFGELYSDLAQVTYKPFEGIVTKFAAK